MPNIPIYSPQVETRSTIDGRSANPNDFGAGVAAAQGQFTDTLNALTQHMFKVHQDAKLENTLANTEGSLHSFAQTLQEGSVDKDGNYAPPPPVEQHAQLYQDHVKSLDEAAQKHLADSDTYLEFKKRFDGAATTYGLQIQKNSIGQAKDAALATFNEAIDKHTQTAAASGGLLRENAVLAAGNSIDVLARAGLITDVQAVERKKKLSHEVDVADAKAALRDPKQAIKDFEDPTKFPELHAGERQQYITHAINLMDKDMREAAAAADRADRQYERNQRVVQRETGKSAQDALTAGTLTMDWIRANRDNMSEADHRYFVDKLANPREVKSDPKVYASLRIRHANGEDVQAEAEAHYRGGDLSHTDFNILTTETSGDPVRKKTWVKDGESYLKTAFYIDRYSSEPQKHLLAETLDRWRSWVDSHPDATPDEARKEHTALAASAARMDFSVNPAAVALPRNFAGGRAVAMKDRAAVAAAWKKTRDEFAKGDLKVEQLNQESDIVDSWVQIIQNREAADAAAAASKTAPGK